MNNKRIEDINITQKSVNDFLNSLEGKRVLMNLKYLIKGYKPIKRTRKRQIMKAKLMSLPPYQRKRYKALNIIANAICSCGISINELSKSKKHHSVTNRKRWK
ncbi:hypothetical protein DKZ22_11125 [Limosilactobacillus reuteri]|uniref:Uncharacterized protein n=1 Tax=Limosilactobacillus reuteri TaxID=1598 RepID=A0A855Y0Y2_LIMRT|nr:hypothetical protein [Limosilactobacillus reuteri]PWT35871.1 hypothetical protein DKZ24_02145 [Limosilactobacillus reuteri]PWT39370.1 hypothetical protein DKZ22_11125 [Limosilactobacillus reuteri]PWT55386.1 hypothetical protein DKZ31_03410 [Limosilactobacillus reuteri]PWT61164.1 hypothetical protein DKZ30_01490 [Limosilactobacillus reuteri]PWT65624.1 hypothetical protein DKZ20_02505 [Limosilactobacillus reuteri]